MTRGVLVVCTLLLGACQAPLATRPADPARSTAAEPVRVTVKAKDEDLADVMELIGRQVGWNLLVDPDVDETVEVTLVDVPWREAVSVLAAQTGCELQEHPGRVLLLTQPLRVSVSAEGRDVRELLAEIIGAAGHLPLMCPGVQGRVSIELEGVHWVRAMQRVLEALPGEYEFEPKHLVRVWCRVCLGQGEVGPVLLELHSR